MKPPAGGLEGTTIQGKYTLIKLLGEGAFAQVYLARSLLTGAEVAIKVTEKASTNVRFAPHIEREVAIMQRLRNHPNILRIHELLATTTKIYMVMDLARTDLFKVLEGLPYHRLGLDEALGVFHQLVSALHFCHRHGVSHRDIKPQNVLLDFHGDVLLSDFGLSSMATEGSSSTTVAHLLQSAVGTLPFMAPEVMPGNNRRYAGHMADAWSCGVILYMMLAGSLPFHPHDTNHMMNQKKLRRQYRFPAHFPALAKALVHRLLDPSPETRLSIEEIANDSFFRDSPFGDKNNSVAFEEMIVRNEGRFEEGSRANAFHIIGFDLSGLGDDGVGRKTRRFVVEGGVGAVVERVANVGAKKRYAVKNGQGGKIWLNSGKLLVMVEVMEVVPELSVVDMVVVEGCCCIYCGGDDSVLGGEICGGIEEALSWCLP